MYYNHLHAKSLIKAEKSKDGIKPDLFAGAI